MVWKHYRPEEISSTLHEVRTLLAHGMKIPEVVKEFGSGDAAYYP